MVDILMAVFNGEKFIKKQIDSILAQSFDDWHLIIRDDGSTDKSVEIICDIIKQHPEKITLVCAQNSGSAKANFFELTKLAKSDYIMFCDHDDFWLPDKIKLTLSKAKALECKYGKNTPVLVHTDLSVADIDLNITAPSFFEYQGLDKNARTLSRLLAQNNVTGCTMMINKALLDLCVATYPKDLESGILMHDWWLALLAAACGKIGFVNKPTILYRQHGNNELGAINTKSIKYIAKSLKKRKSAGRLNATYIQAAALYTALKDTADEQSLETIKRFVAIPAQNKIAKIHTIIKYDYKKQNFVSLTGQLIFC